MNAFFAQQSLAFAGRQRAVGGVADFAVEEHVAHVIRVGAQVLVEQKSARWMRQSVLQQRALLK